MSQDFEILQGVTLSLPFFWYDGDPVVKAITAATADYPPVLTAAAHGLPTSKIPVRIVTVKGPTELNSPADGSTIYALKTGSDTFSLPDTNAGVFSAPFVAGGGFLVYQKPKDLTGFTARMQLRSGVTSTTVILDLTDVNGDILLGGTEGSITLILSSIQTALFTFPTAVYDLHLTSAGGVVTRVASGTITVSPEVTR
jgi:hypothetical protein